MKLKRVVFIFIIFLLLLAPNCFASSYLELNTLHYDVTLNSDGSANVTETWDINIEDTNTLFKTFEIDNSKYSGITDVSVVETTDGMNKSFYQIYEEKYHVNKDAFYSLINSKGQFEIAWGVHEDDDYARRIFNISYTIIDAVKNYSDCSEFYWQFISEESAIPAENVTGTITLPNNVSNNEDFRVWAHGPLNGNIFKTSNNTASFEVADLRSYTMLEARIVTPTYVFENNENTSSSSKLSYILAQEQEWAEEANRKRENQARMQRIGKIMTIAFFVLSNIGGIVLAIFLIRKIGKYKKQLEVAPNYKPSMPSKYYRDIPNDATPAEAAFLYYFKTSAMSLHISSVFSATMLNLCLKKYLSFEKVANKKDEIKVIINPNISTDNLSKDEKDIFELLQKVSSTNEFTMKEFEKYCGKHSTAFNKVYNSLEPTAKKAQESLGNYDSKIIKEYNNYVAKVVGFVFLLIISAVIMWASVIPSIMCIIYCSKLASRYNTLTQKGVDEKEKWVGLKNYMEDFSMMKEKEVPELILWEKYLVFATAFGIADKVLKQLKVVYPQLNDENYLHTNGYTYLYFMAHSNMSTNFVSTLNNSISNTYSSINYSSGSGSGGGFSGGGGFGGGGGRNGRTLSHLGTIRGSPQLRHCHNLYQPLNYFLLLVI